MGRFAAETWFPIATPVVIFGIAATAVTGVAGYDVINNQLQLAAATSPDTRRYVYTAMLPSTYWGAENVHQHPTADGYLMAAALAAQAFVGESGRGLLQGGVIDPLTGFIGVGTSTPITPVHITTVGTLTAAAAIRADADGASCGALWYAYGINAAQAGFNSARKARGSAAAPTAALSGDTLMSFGGAGYGARAFPGGNSVSVDFLTSQDQSDTTQGSTVAISTTSNNTTAKTQRLLIQHDGTTRPGADNAYTLGSSSFRWASIWAANGTVQTSDARDKDVVGDLVFAGAMVDAIDPVLFKWKVGGNIVQPSATETMLDEMGNVVPAMESVPRAGERVHAGFLAQSLKGAMDAASVDFGAWGVDDLADPDSRQWTRPDQLVAVLWAALKETRAELAKIKSALPSPRVSSASPSHFEREGRRNRGPSA